MNDVLPDEVEVCLERIPLVGEQGGSACRPRWGRKDGWYCDTCKGPILLMRPIAVDESEVAAESVEEKETWDMCAPADADVAPLNVTEQLRAAKAAGLDDLPGCGDNVLEHSWRRRDDDLLECERCGTMAVVLPTVGAE